jgi:hypothetical protein
MKRVVIYFVLAILICLVPSPEGQGDVSDAIMVIRLGQKLNTLMLDKEGWRIRALRAEAAANKFIESNTRSLLGLGCTVFDETAADRVAMDSVLPDIIKKGEGG